MAGVEQTSSLSEVAVALPESKASSVPLDSVTTTSLRMIEMTQLTTVATTDANKPAMSE